MDATEIVRRLGLVAAKARSNAAEAETIEVAQMLDPTLYGDGDLSLITVSERMLEGGRTPEGIDVYNILYLAHHRSPTAALVYAVLWGEDLPLPTLALVVE